MIFRTGVWRQTVQLWRGVHQSIVPCKLSQQFTVPLGCVSSHWDYSPAEVHRWDRHHFKIMYHNMSSHYILVSEVSLLALPKLTLLCITCTVFLPSFFLQILLFALYNDYIQSQIFSCNCLPFKSAPLYSKTH
jgi:hypothetical protein